MCDPEKAVPIITTLSDQIDRMNQVVATKMHGYKPQIGIVTAEAILKILKRHSRVAMAGGEEQKIRSSIELAISKDERIPIGFTWGCSGMALSNMKLRERVNFPRKGDVWCLWWFDILNQKVKTYYKPGISLIIGDEVPHFHALGWTYKEVVRRHEIMKSLAEQHFDFIKVVAIPDYAVTVEDVDIAVPSMEEILAIATSLPDNNIPQEVFDTLYSERTKNWSWIRRQIPTEIWEEARWVIAKASKIGRLRKEYGFFEHLFGTSAYIDAALTEKERFCPKPWSLTTPQHGGSVLTASVITGKYSIAIMPEYRLIDQSTEHEPVMINTLEFQHFTGCPVKESLYTFYWQRIQ